MLDIIQIKVGGYDENFAYVIANQDTNEGWLVDPCGDAALLLRTFEESGLILSAILITHTDFDHIDALRDVLAAHPAPIYVHERGADAILPAPDKKLADGDVLVFGNHTIEVIYTPGHTDDSVCFYIKATHTADSIPRLIAGDTLFIHGCGRTTRTRVKDLYESLAELKQLPENTIIYPGHDYGPTPTSTIGEEKQHNRFFLAGNFNDFVRERLG